MNPLGGDALQRGLDQVAGLSELSVGGIAQIALTCVIIGLAIYISLKIVSKLFRTVVVVGGIAVAVFLFYHFDPMGIATYFLSHIRNLGG